jgi:hypothetical protein
VETFEIEPREFRETPLLWANPEPSLARGRCNDYLEKRVENSVLEALGVPKGS